MLRHREHRSGRPGPFRENRRALLRVDDPYAAGNGSIMRLAPVPMFYAGDPEEAIVRVRGKLPHHPRGPDLRGCLPVFRRTARGGAERGGQRNLLSDHYSPVPGYWEQPTLWERRSTRSPPGPSSTRTRPRSSAPVTWSSPWRPPSGLSTAAILSGKGPCWPSTWATTPTPPGRSMARSPGRTMGMKGSRRMADPDCPTEIDRIVCRSTARAFTPVSRLWELIYSA